jgi:sugar-specific transcriptional regulator TrmB
MIKELQTIGLTKNQALVYEGLVENGPCRAGVLINKLDIHRNLVYDCLEKLIKKGFAYKVDKSKVWEFHITEPGHLLTALRRQEGAISNIVEQIQTHYHKSNQQFVVYEGIESYRQYWLGSIERVPEGTTDYCLGAPTNLEWEHIIGSKIYHQYMKRRVERKIKWQTLHFKITESELSLLRQYPDLTEYRLWPRDVKCKGNFNIIHDTIMLHTFDPLRIIEIRDTIMVEVFKNYFDMMWEKSEPVNISNKKFKNTYFV